MCVAMYLNHIFSSSIVKASVNKRCYTLETEQAIGLTRLVFRYHKERDYDFCENSNMQGFPRYGHI